MNVVTHERGFPRATALPSRVVDPRGVECTAEEILDAVRRWTKRYGAPPTVADWDPSRASRINQRWRAERFHAGDWPDAAVVRAAFRTFNAAVEMAGLTPQPLPRRDPPPFAEHELPCRSEPDAQWRAVAVATAEAAAEPRRPGADQVTERIRAVSAARRARDRHVLHAELIRLAGSVLAWADTVAGDKVSEDVP